MYIKYFKFLFVFILVNYQIYIVSLYINLFIINNIFLELLIIIILYLFLNIIENLIVVFLIHFQF